MKKTFTKVLSVLLTLCMLAGMMIIPIGADEPEQSDGIITPDTSWYKSKEVVSKTYELSTAEQLLGFAQLAQTHDFAGETIKLMADIDLNPGWDATTTVGDDKVVTLANAPQNVWTSIPKFSGTLDGNGKTISGIYSCTDFTVPESYAKGLGGFINVLENGEISNLIVRNSLAVFHSTTATSGSRKLHIGGFIGHAIDSTLETLYVDIDTWSKFNYHLIIGGMIGCFGTKQSNRVYGGTVEDLVYAGCVGTMPAEGGAYNHSTNGTANAVKYRIGGMIAANEEWDAQTNIGLTMKNIAIIGNVFKPGSTGGDPLLCYTTADGNHYNYGIAINNSAIYISSTYWGANKNTTKQLTDVAEDIKNRNPIVVADDTYEQTGWVSVNANDNVAFANGAGTATILLPGSVVDMIEASSYVQDTESANERITANIDWFDSGAVAPEAKNEVYYLYDAADLLGLSELANKGIDFEGVTIKLMADIDLNPDWNNTTSVADDKTVTLADAPKNVWKPIPKFSGTLDGNGHTVSGIYSYTDFTVPVNSIRDIGGFINTLENGEIKNLAIKDSLSFFESTSTAALVAEGKSGSGSSSIHIGGFIGHLVDSTLTTLYVDMDAWVEFDYHFIFGGMICALGTNSADGNYAGTVEDIVFAGTVGVISSTSNLWNGSGKRSSNIRMAGMIAANQSWKFDSNVIVTMENLAFIGTVYKSGAVSGDPLLCYTGTAGSYNMGIGINNLVWYNGSDWNDTHYGDGAATLDSVANDEGRNANAVVTAGDTYADAGWKSVTVADNAAFANGAGKETILLPGSVVDMLNSNSLSTSDLYVQEKLDGSAIRFIGVVDVSEAELANLDSLGMNVSMTYDGKTYSYSFTTTTVYKSLVANGVTVNVSELNGTYFYAIEITGLNGATDEVKFDFSGTVTPNGAESVVFASASYTYTPAAN